MFAADDDYRGMGVYCRPVIGLLGCCCIRHGVFDCESVGDEDEREGQVKNNIE